MVECRPLRFFVSTLDKDGYMAAEKIDLTLCVPGLSAIAKAGITMPLLQRMLSRAGKVKSARGGEERLLFALFDFSIPAKSPLPIAPLTYYLDCGEPATGALLRADPVYCQASRNQVIMVAAGLDLSMDEAEQMVEELNGLFAEDGWCFTAATPQRWYLRMPGAAQLQAEPLSQVLGKDIHQYLPRLEGAETLHRSLTEIEMLLHANQANQQRQMQQQLPVTNLWLWGGGELPVPPVCDFVQVWSGDALALALAKYAGVPRTDAPEDAATWLQQQTTPGRHLLTLSSLENPLEFESQWMIPLAEALSSGRLNSLELQLGNGYGYRINKRSQRRWWRRTKPLGTLL